MTRVSNNGSSLIRRVFAVAVLGVVAVAAALLQPATTGHAQAAGIHDIDAFLELCPTDDPIYLQIRSDFQIRRNGVLVGDLTCTGPTSSLPDEAWSGELNVVQTLRTIYYMDLGRSGHLPWTAGTLYDWLKLKLDGVNINDLEGASFCCNYYDGALHIELSTNGALQAGDRIWPYIAGNIELIMHEARHVDGFLHVTGCPFFPLPTDPGGCDPEYNEANLSAYGIEYWLYKSLLTGYIEVGFACSPRGQPNSRLSSSSATLTPSTGAS